MSLRAALLAVLVAAVVRAALPDEPQPQQVSVLRTARAVRDQSVSFGTLNPYDRVLASRNVYVSSSFLTVHEEKVNIFVTSGVITHIKVDDLMKNGNNAEVKLKSGGPGYSEVTLKFKSKRGEKINYIVTVYGR